MLSILTLSFLVNQAPAVSCHTKIDAQCVHLRDEERLFCREWRDAQCDIDDIEMFVGDRDIDNALSRIDQATAKYERLIAATDRSRLSRLSAAMVRYAVVTQSVFALLSLDGEVEHLDRAVTRLRAGLSFLRRLLKRIPALSADPDITTAISDLVARLTTALEHLSDREVARADTRFIEAKASGREETFGAARDLYDRAAMHLAEAYDLTPTTSAYRADEMRARLAKAAVQAALGRSDRRAAERACADSRDVMRRIDAFKRDHPAQWRTVDLVKAREQAVRGASDGVCRSDRAYFISAGVLAGVGAALGLSSGLVYGAYHRDCAFDRETNYCAGIVAGTQAAEQATLKVQASIGMAVVGGTLVMTGGVLLWRGLVQRKRVGRGETVAIAPTFDRHLRGLTLRLRF